jgi:hypothetical protein
MHYKRIKVMVKRRSYSNHSFTFSVNMLVFIRHFNYFIYQILLIIISNSNDVYVHRENEQRRVRGDMIQKYNFLHDFQKINWYRGPMTREHRSNRQGINRDLFLFYSLEILT